MDEFLDEQAMVLQYGAIKIQSIARMIVVRCRVLKKLNERYEKIYDPRRERYYYYDKETDTSSWGKPLLLLKSDINVISPTYLEDGEKDKSNLADAESVTTLGSEQLNNNALTDEDDEDDSESDKGEIESKESEIESELDSDDSEAVRERRRLRRKYPR